MCVREGGDEEYVKRRERDGMCEERYVYVGEEKEERV